jgi:hypothetical protein
MRLIRTEVKAGSGWYAVDGLAPSFHARITRLASVDWRNCFFLKSANTLALMPVPMCHGATGGVRTERSVRLARS